jgi:hypothetical protein
MRFNVLVQLKLMVQIAERNGRIQNLTDNYIQSLPVVEVFF